MNEQTNRLLSNVCFAMGFISIGGSILIWQNKGYEGKSGSKDGSHAERMGIFVGLWAPTFFVLSTRFEEAALRQVAERAAKES